MTLSCLTTAQGCGGIRHRLAQCHCGGRNPSEETAYNQKFGSDGHLLYFIGAQGRNGSRDHCAQRYCAGGRRGLDVPPHSFGDVSRMSHLVCRASSRPRETRCIGGTYLQARPAVLSTAEPVCTCVGAPRGCDCSGSGAAEHDGGLASSARAHRRPVPVVLQRSTINFVCEIFVHPQASMQTQ